MILEEVAEAVGRSLTRVAKCDLGERRVDFVEREDLAEALGQQLDRGRTRRGA